MNSYKSWPEQCCVDSSVTLCSCSAYTSLFPPAVTQMIPSCWFVNVYTKRDEKNTHRGQTLSLSLSHHSQVVRFAGTHSYLASTTYTCVKTVKLALPLTPSSGERYCLLCLSHMSASPSSLCGVFMNVHEKRREKKRSMGC